MGAYSGEAKNAQTNAIARKTAPSIAAEWVTIASQEAFAPEASAVGKKIKLTGAKAKGYVNGAIVVFTELNGKTVEGESSGGLFIGRPYWVVGEATNEFELAYTKGGTGIEFTVEVKATSSISIVKEHTGAKTKRIKTAFAEATDATGGVAKDAAREIEATATVKVRWIMYFSAETEGTFIGCSKVTEKELAEADLYKVTAGELSENAVQ